MDLCCRLLGCRTRDDAATICIQNTRVNSFSSLAQDSVGNLSGGRVAVWTRIDIV
ncbi:hypothetical protein L218DRAFT_967078 [Marasmius fiardii PR-910]|nr:hypothetical protein L218DRAFT_967078 [Marasmius fiardii PR-910]